MIVRLFLVEVFYFRQKIYGKLQLFKLIKMFVYF